MKVYKEFQFGWLVLVFLIPIQLLLSYLLLTRDGFESLSSPGLMIVNGIFIGIYILFYGMRTVVDREHLRVSFGIGLLGTRISLKNIKTMTPVENRWYFGWGIRYIPNGMLYNIGGFKAVEFSFETTKSVLRVGTKNPEALTKAIRDVLKC